jgi:hypothetical protein
LRGAAADRPRFDLRPEGDLLGALAAIALSLALVLTVLGVIPHATARLIPWSSLRQMSEAAVPPTSRPNEHLGGCQTQPSRPIMRAMDELKLQNRDVPTIRSFRICLDHPHRQTTILGVVRRVAAEQAHSAQASRTIALPRRQGAFA